MDALPDAVYLIDPASSHIVWVNRQGWEMLGMTCDEVLGHSVLTLQMDVSGVPQWEDMASVIRQSNPYVFVGRHRHAAGHEVAVEVKTSALQLDGREYFISVARDITLRMALEATLHTREDQLWFALNEASDGLWDWEIATGALFFSPQLQRMLGYGPEEMPPVLATWSDNVHPDDLPRVMSTLQEHLQGKRGRYEAEYRLRNRNGHYLWVHDRGRVCARTADGQATHVVGMVQDITQRKQLETQLLEYASQDMLTGLRNRREGLALLESEIQLCLRLDLPLSLCFFDIDHFKSINDHCGHAVGDIRLRQVAEAAVQAVRRTDTVCRWGGDEFVVILPNTAGDQALHVAEKLRAAVLAAHIEAMPPHQQLTISIGVATCPPDSANAHLLIEQADTALYRAKRHGRNRVEHA